MKDFRLTDCKNANVKSEKVEKWETTPVFFWKIIEKKLARFTKNSYLCIVDVKETKASIIFGLAMEKIFLSARGSSAWLNGENKE